MSVVSLQRYPDDERGQAAFAFDHANEHVKLVAQMGVGATSFSLINYLLDPMPPDSMGGASLLSRRWFASRPRQAWRWTSCPRATRLRRSMRDGCSPR